MQIDIFDLYDSEKCQIWRKRNRIRLTDIAKYCKCTASAISQFENGILDLSDEKKDKYEEYIKLHEVRQDK